MQKKDELKKFSFLTFMLHSMIGIVIWLIFLLLCSILISTETLPANTMIHSACISVFFGSFAASLVSAVKFGKRLITALLQGLVYFIFLYLFGALIYGRVLPDILTPVIPASCFLGALFGGIFSVFFKSRKH